MLEQPLFFFTAPAVSYGSKAESSVLVARVKELEAQLAELSKEYDEVSKDLTTQSKYTSFYFGTSKRSQSNSDFLLLEKCQRIEGFLDAEAHVLEQSPPDGLLNQLTSRIRDVLLVFYPFLSQSTTLNFQIRGGPNPGHLRSRVRYLLLLLFIYSKNV